MKTIPFRGKKKNILPVFQSISPDSFIVLNIFHLTKLHDALQHTRLSFVQAFSFISLVARGSILTSEATSQTSPHKQ